MMLTKFSRSQPRRNRSGTLLPLLALSMVVLAGFLALAIDLGMMAISKTQAQNAADLAALTAARTLTGDSTTNYNQTAATANAQNVLSHNTILNQSVQSSQLSLTYGSYNYSDSTQLFRTNFPAVSGSPATAVAATVTSASSGGFFAKVMGFKLTPSVTATAQAVHRPRDIALSIDFSGSMRMGTELGYDFTTNSRSTNNPDTLYPQFGQYTSSNAGFKGPSTNRLSSSSYTVSPSNTTTTNSSYSMTYVNSFFQNAAYASTLIRAFDSYTSSDGGATWVAPSSGSPQLPPSSYATTPGGDQPLFAFGSTTNYAQSVTSGTNATSFNLLWELDGYSLFPNGSPTPTVWTESDYSDPAIQFNGYTQGPGYYGKTFFMWPPDPRAGPITSTSTVKSFLTAMGMSTAAANYISGRWVSVYQAQGMTTGLATLKADLITYGYPLKPVSSSQYMTGSYSTSPIYCAVCRLFNRGYPAGVANGAFIGDWRVRFFGTNNNTLLFNPSASTYGILNLPSSSTYSINYNAILAWIAQSPNPFPTQMRSGNIKYYGSIPTSITGTWPSYGGTDQQFWVQVIDSTLGLWQTAAGVYQDVSKISGYGGDFTWGTTLITAPPAAPQSIGYSDNPARPLVRFWFGPLNMVDYMMNDNYFHMGVSNYFMIHPGNAYEAPAYVCKEAYIAAINTMEYNHPNDWFTVVPYSAPRYSATDTAGRFNVVRVPLGTNYTYAVNALAYPFGTLAATGGTNGTEITPFTPDPTTGLVPSADFWDTPRAMGNTCFAMALMLCYNQFAVTPASDGTLRQYVSSSPITFPTGMAGGLGRKGAQKVVVFETDGIIDAQATANLITTSNYSYYQIRYDMNNPNSAEYPSSSSSVAGSTQVYNLVQQLANTYGTSRNPFRLYGIGFGPVFQSSQAYAAETTLQTMQYYAGTQTSASTALPSSQIIVGTGAQMSANMISAYTSILQNGVQIALIK